MKITPAHDQNDYDCGKRNNLDFINIIDDSGNITSDGGHFAVSAFCVYSQNITYIGPCSPILPLHGNPERCIANIKYQQDTDKY